jgi:hypothetical protein
LTGNVDEAVHVELLSRIVSLINLIASVSIWSQR